VTATAAGDDLTRLRRNYTPPFLAHLARQDEKTLRAAYELGRDAIACGLTVLDLVDVHHAVFSEVLRSDGGTDDLPAMVQAAAAFLVEALAPFEMTRQPLRGPDDVET
jgi:hypothetical protein